MEGRLFPLIFAMGLIGPQELWWVVSGTFPGKERSEAVGGITWGLVLRDRTLLGGFQTGNLTENRFPR